MTLQDASALVTGGASGIGAATVRALAQRGHRVVVADTSADAGAALAEEVGGLFVRTDVIDPAQVRAAVLAAAELGPLRAAVSSAAVGWTEPLARPEGGPDAAHSMERFERVLRVNLFGTFDLVRTAASVMAEQQPVSSEPESEERGAIVMISSIEAFEGHQGQTAYVASKAAINGLALTMARDLAACGVRVNTVAPGFVDTPMYGTDAESEEFKATLARDVPFPRRLGAAEEVASLVLECLTNRYLNGSTLRVDGAMRFGPFLPPRPHRAPRGE